MPNGLSPRPRPVLRAVAWGRDFAILEYAEISVKSLLMMVRYDSPEAAAATLHEGWFPTGDLASMDANGLFFLL